jgi:hypothetical protein
MKLSVLLMGVFALAVLAAYVDARIDAYQLEKDCLIIENNRAKHLTIP